MKMVPICSLKHLVAFSFFLGGALMSTECLAHEYVFEDMGSPLLDGKQLVPMRSQLKYRLEDMQVFDGLQSRDFKRCAPEYEMYCFDDSSNGWVLYFPRSKSSRTRWEVGGRTYVFEGWQKPPFANSTKPIATIHAFSTSTIADREKAGGDAYPIETYYIDQQMRLVGMMRYELKNPEYRGMNQNMIRDLYWVKGSGLPLESERH